MNKKISFYFGLAIFSLISFIILSLVNDVQADHYVGHAIQQQYVIETLNDHMLELYSLTKDINKIAAYNKLQSIKLLVQQNHSILSMQYEHWHLFEDELEKLEKQLITKQNNQLWKETINRLILTTDAMVQGDDGPWREYEVLMLDRIRLMESSFINQESYRATTMQANLIILEEQLNRITLAAQLVGNKPRLEELQFRVLDMKTFMVAMALNEPEQLRYYTELSQSISGIKQTTLSLFENSTVVSVEPILSNKTFPLQVALLLALLITIVLTFTTYRKYKQVPYGIKKI